MGIAKQNPDASPVESCISQIASAIQLIEAFLWALVCQTNNTQNLNAAIDTLKQKYLSHREQYSIKHDWSAFEDPDRRSDIGLKQVESVFNEYFDFYILYSLYSTDALDLNATLCELAPWGILNHYAAYKLSAKR